MPRECASRVAAPAISATPFVARPVTDVTRFPYSACGKLFYRLNGVAYWSTAFIVAQRGLFTAAHNLENAGVQAADLEFLLQYEKGKSAGVWSLDASRAHIPPEWRQPNATATFDFATIGTTTDLPIAETGVLAFRASARLPQGAPVTVIGYPGAPFDGEVMWECQGAGSWTIVLSMASGNYTSGAGGGPWILDAEGEPVVVGATADTFPEDDVLTSPPFNEVVQQYIRAVGGP